MKKFRFSLSVRNFLKRFWFPFLGFIAFIWFLVRVIPKPSRAYYPCQKAAFPLASAFIIWITGFFASTLLVRKARKWLNKSKYYFGLASLLGAIVVFILINVYAGSKKTYAVLNPNDEFFVPSEGPNQPMGIPQGIYPGRVVWVHDPAAALWDGIGSWYTDDDNDQAVVDDMMSNALLSLTGEDDLTQAWDTLFRYFNVNHDRGNLGYQENEKIAIKLNLNKVGSVAQRSKTAFTSPHVVMALTKQLIEVVGVNESDITFYDANRLVPNAIYNKLVADYPGIHFEGSEDVSGRKRHERDLNCAYQWSEDLTLEIGGGHTTYLPKSVTEASYFINLANMKGHRYAGVTFGSKNHFGSISNDGDNGKPSGNAPKSAGLHPYMAVHDMIVPGSDAWTFYGRADSTYNSIIDVAGHKYLAGNTLLYIIDGLYATPTEQDDLSELCKWIMPPFNNDWTSSLFMSQDAMGIESVGLDFYINEQQINDNVYPVYGSVDNYLHEGSMAHDPPSGTFYDPEGDGIRMNSLGVHEHWNNPEDMQYSRNLGTGDGIELIQLKSTIDAPAGLVAVFNDENQVELTWNAVTEADKYIVKRSLGDNQHYETLAIVDDGTALYTDEAIDEETVYFYRVKALSGSDYSDFSEEAEVDLTVGLNAFSSFNEKVSIQFNPLVDKVNVQIDHIEKGLVTMEIYDMSGRMLHRYLDFKYNQDFQRQVDINNLAKGTYVFSVRVNKFKSSCLIQN